MKNIKKKYLIIGGIILIVGGYYWYSKSKSTTTAVQYKTAKAEMGTITTSISASGNVVVDDSATVDPTITGTVYGLAVSVGDKVKKGQLLFMINNDQVGIDASKAYSSYLQSKASLETSKASKKEAKNNYEDASSDERSILKRRLEAAEISLEVAERNVQTSWASYQNSLSDASDRKVVSPIDGTVNAVNIKNGDDLSRLSSNSNSSAPIIIGDLSTLKAQVDVNEVDIADVKVGQKTTITFDAIDDLSTTGKVEKIDALGTLTSGVVTYNVTIGFDSLDERIKSQMSVSTEIFVNSKQDIITVSNSAIKTRNGKNYVQVLTNGKPEDRTVEIGIANDTDTEIISGVGAGDNVITQITNSPTSKSTVSSSPGSSSGSSSSNNRPPGGGIMGF